MVLQFRRIKRLGNANIIEIALLLTPVDENPIEAEIKNYDKVIWKSLTTFKCTAGEWDTLCGPNFSKYNQIASQVYITDDFPVA